MTENIIHDDIDLSDEEVVILLEEAALLEEGEVSMFKTYWNTDPPVEII